VVLLSLTNLEDSSVTIELDLNILKFSSID
jgi:hypothetical protein